MQGKVLHGKVMQLVHIREYQPGDWPRLQAIHDKARRCELVLAGLETAFLPLDIAARREGLFDNKIFVACSEQNPVGFTACTKDEIAWLYVDPDIQRRGIGRQLVLFALEYLSDSPEITVEVLVGNTPARRLYEACGFQFYERLSGVMPGNERFHVTVDVLKAVRRSA